MSEEKGSSLSTERIILIVVSTLLVISLAYLGISALVRRGQEAPPPDAAPVEPADEQSAAALPTEPPAVVVEPTGEPIVDADATPTPRRLALAPTPTPFALSGEDDPRAILDLLNPFHFDYFDSPDNWFDYDSEGFAAYFVQGSKLQAKDYDPVNTAVYWSFSAQQSGNLYAEISATNGDCIGRDAVGFAVRIDPEQSPSGYALEIACDGAWRFLRFHPGGQPTVTLIDWTASDTIHQGLGATNRMGIWAYQGKFHLFINGFHVDEYYDSSYPWSYGVFAAYVRAAQTYDLTAEFDDFSFWHIRFIE
ncbi:MAG: hypothetical protein U9N80_07290 [Chloroflexota bacterium]|nr:hypothetical protein [Chloroflexota bacterium]